MCFGKPCYITQTNISHDDKVTDVNKPYEDFELNCLMKCEWENEEFGYLFGRKAKGFSGLFHFPNLQGLTSVSVGQIQYESRIALAS